MASRVLPEFLAMLKPLVAKTLLYVASTTRLEAPQVPGRLVCKRFSKRSDDDESLRTQEEVGAQ